jgi:hypothetical protein
MAEISRLPRPVADEWEWQYQGSCRELPSEMFFHPDGERGPRRRNRENTAKAICASCPVIAACRAHALAEFGEAYQKMIASPSSEKISTQTFHTLLKFQ